MKNKSFWKFDIILLLGTLVNAKFSIFSNPGGISTFK